MISTTFPGKRHGPTIAYPCLEFFHRGGNRLFTLDLRFLGLVCLFERSRIIANNRAQSSRVRSFTIGVRSPAGVARCGEITARRRGRPCRPVRMEEQDRPGGKGANRGNTASYRPGKPCGPVAAWPVRLPRGGRRRPRVGPRRQRRGKMRHGRRERLDLAQGKPLRHALCASRWCSPAAARPATTAEVPRW